MSNSNRASIVGQSMQNFANNLTQLKQELGNKTKRSISPPKRSVSPPRVGGRLHVLVIEAKSLRPKEKKDVVSVVSNIVENTWASDDPFCKVTVGKKTFKTSPKLGTLSPKWNEKFVFDAVDNNDVLKCVLRDNLTIGKGHFFGEVNIPVPTLKKYQEVEDWYALCKRSSITTDVSGSIHLKLYYQPDKDKDPPASFMSNASPENTEVSCSPKETSPIEQAATEDDTEDESSPEETTNDYTASSSQAVPIASTKSDLLISSSPNNISMLTNSAPPGGFEPLLQSSDSDEPNNNNFNINNNNNNINLTRPISSSLSTQIRPKSSLNARYTISSDDPIQPGSPQKRKQSVKPNSTLQVTGQLVESDPLAREVSARLDAKVHEKNEAFMKRFNLPSDEKLFKVFSAALHKQLLLHGRLFISQNFICFHSNIFGIKTTEVIPIRDILDVKKNFFNLSLGIQIITTSKQLNFGSFFSRDKAFDAINRVWKRGIEPLGSADDNKSNKDDEKIEDDAAEDDDHWEEAFLSLEDADGGFLTSENLTQLINEEFNVSVLTFFKLFFSDSNFVRLYHEGRNDKEITVKDWSSNTQYGTTRQLQYRAPLRQPIGPSSADCEETQRYHLSKTHLTVETILVMYNIPYGDYFRVESKWQVTTLPNNNNACKLSVFSGVHFMKKTFFKSKIESGAMKESEESFNMWVQLARKEIQKMNDREPKDSLKKASSIDNAPPSPSGTGAPATDSVTSSPASTKRSTITESLRALDWTFAGLCLLVLLFLAVLLWTGGLKLDTQTAGFLLVVGFLGYRSYRLEQKLTAIEAAIKKE